MQSTTNERPTAAHLSDELSRELWLKDKEHFTHPYTNMSTFHDKGSMIITQGKGHHVVDSYGKTYLDGIAGLWCVNIGHGREDLAEHMAQQARTLAYYNTFGGSTSPAAANLAHKLAQLAPGDLNHVFFGTGGSMANDTAIKLIHYYFNMLGKPNKKLVLSRDLGYHGSSYLAHALTGIRATHIGFDLAPGLVHYLTAPYPYRNQYDTETEQDFCQRLLAEMEAKIVELGPENIACFIAEPIMGAGGVIVPPAGYHLGSYELCRRYDILYISDEVVTAFGRLGHMVASYDEFGFQPDVLILAKGISSGYIPLGATVYSDRIHQVISQPKKDNPYFSHGFTYSGHALACAVGLKNIEIMEQEQLCQHVRQWGPYFEDSLRQLEQLDIVGQVRGSKYMLGIEYVQDKHTKALHSAEQNVAIRIYNRAKEKGLIVRPLGPLNIISPPLTYDKKAIDTTTSILYDSIREVMQQL